VSRFHSLVVRDVRRETPDSVSVAFEVPEALRDAFAFRPGQYLTLRATLGGEDIRRSYSICSGTADGEWRVGIRHVPGGAFSAFANENLRPGDRLDVMPPEGRFTPGPARGPRHVVGIAAGSGITPILSIVRSLLATEPETRLTLVYGNRTTASVMFAEDIEDLKNRHLGRLSVLHLLSRETQDVPLLSGRIDADRIRRIAAGAADLANADEVFVCGPEGMVGEARRALTVLGVPEDRVRAELFTPAAPRATFAPTPAGNAGRPVARVTATVDGRRHAFDLLEGDPDLIAAAARIGMDMPFSCRGGMCCTCRCKVTEGAAAMAVNYSLEPWELDAGFVLACQARPTTPTLALDFDAM
jgi:ring-1,2-phenylacetyl-CoA epoxidase subunit PaaE